MGTRSEIEWTTRLPIQTKLIQQRRRITSTLIKMTKTSQNCPAAQIPIGTTMNLNIHSLMGEREREELFLRNQNSNFRLAMDNNQEVPHPTIPNTANLQWSNTFLIEKNSLRLTGTLNTRTSNPSSSSEQNRRPRRWSGADQSIRCCCRRRRSVKMLIVSTVDCPQQMATAGRKRNVSLQCGIEMEVTSRKTTIFCSFRLTTRLIETESLSLSLSLLPSGIPNIDTETGTEKGNDEEKKKKRCNEPFGQSWLIADKVE